MQTPHLFVKTPVVGRIQARRRAQRLQGGRDSVDLAVDRGGQGAGQMLRLRLDLPSLRPAEPIEQQADGQDGGNEQAKDNDPEMPAEGPLARLRARLCPNGRRVGKLSSAVPAGGVVLRIRQYSLRILPRHLE